MPETIQLLLFDRNTWIQTTMFKLFILDKNTWYHITVYKTLKKSTAQNKMNINIQFKS